MSKHTRHSIPKSILPPNAVRKVNPENGYRMWNIGGMWFSSKREYIAFVASLQSAAAPSAMIENGTDPSPLERTGQETDTLSESSN